VERISAAALALIAAGCVHHATLYGERVPDGCDAAGPSGGDDCAGWWIDRTKMSQLFEVQDPELGRYVTTVATRLARAAGDHRTWHVRVLDEDAVSAEGNVSTTIYISRGALVRLRDEAELAAVLGHEIAHVLAGHLDDAVAEKARGARDRSRDLDAQRDDEVQADELAVRYCHLAGYDIAAVERMLRALAAGDPPDDPDRGNDPHPRWTLRLARVQAYVAHFAAGGTTNAEVFQRHLRGLPAGEDPRTAKRLGDALVFGRAGLALDLPAGFTEATASDDAAEVSYGDALTASLHTLPAHAAPAPPSDSSFRVLDQHGVRFLIAVKGPGQAALFARIVASLRAPTAAELGRLVPTPVDLRAPRALWPESPDDPAHHTWEHLATE
jgi:hypothetical protein